MPIHLESMNLNLRVTLPRTAIARLSLPCNYGDLKWDGCFSGQCNDLQPDLRGHYLYLNPVHNQSILRIPSYQFDSGLSLSLKFAVK